MRLLSTFSIVFIFTINFCNAQSTITVPGDYQTIQSALDIAESGTTILVAPGNYYENLVWPEDIDGIKLIGEQGSDVTIIDGQGIDRVLYFPYSWDNLITSTTIVEGLTLQNGYVFDDNGAGLYLREGSLTLRDVIFKNNRGDGERTSGAGAFIGEFNGIIENCKFIMNEINTTSRSYGAGLNLAILDEATLLNCTFEGNHGKTLNWAHGGGLYVSGEFGLTNPPTIKVINCDFTNNSTTTESWSYGAGAYFDDFDNLIVRIDSSKFERNIANISTWSHGGAIHTGTTDIEINNSQFISNSAESGAGIYFSTQSFNGLGSGLVYNSVFSDNVNLSGNTSGGSAFYIGYDAMDLTLENCIIDHNKDSPIDFDISDEGGVLNFNHCTIAFNGEGLEIDGITMNATNSIFWNNDDTEFNTGWNPAEIILENCIVKGGYEGESIIDAYPGFIDEFLLIPNEDSPCLSAGIPSTINTDINGNQRPMPANSYPDIGAYEIDQYFAHVLVRFFIDEDENGVKDDSEQYSSLGSVNVDGITSYNNFRKEGVYIVVPQGSISLSYNEAWDTRWQVTNQSEYQYNVNTEDFSQIIEYGIFPSIDLTDVRSSITSNSFRCGEEIDFTLTLKNRGTTIADGIAWLTLDNRVEEFTFSTYPDYSFSDNLVGWDFENLLPGESLEIDFLVIAPLIENEEQVGELYCFSAELEIEENNRPNSFNYKTELRCSFDPNDKLVNPFRPDSLSLIEDEFVYTIRFQNTGNDYARNVVITDTIDENLDLSTFELINCSHPDILQITVDENREIKFDFSGIYLQDSISNEPASHGFINYRIEPIEDVVLNTNITNTANIYFDFNPPIVTNTTHNILVNEFPTSSIYNLSNADIESYPNPALEYIYLSKQVDNVYIYNSLGKLVMQTKLTDKVNVQSLPIGTYFVEYKLENKLATDTWVIMR